VICLVSGGLFSTATVFLKAFTEEFGWSRGQVSGAFSLGIVVAGLAAPLWGRIADRRGPRSSFIPGALIAGAVCLLLSRLSGIATLYVLYAVFAFGSAGIYFVPISVLLSRWFVEMRGRAIGIAYMGEGFGILLFAPAAGVLVTTIGGPVVLLRGHAPADRHWIGLTLEATQGARDAYGARAVVVAGGRRHVRIAHARSGYLSQSDPRMLFGLGAVTDVERIEVVWPGGTRETFSNLALDRYHHIVEGRGGP